MTETHASPKFRELLAKLHQVQDRIGAHGPDNYLIEERRVICSEMRPLIEDGGQSTGNSYEDAWVVLDSLEAPPSSVMDSLCEV